MNSPFFDIDPEILRTSEEAARLCSAQFAEIEKIQEYNQQKMLKAFQLAGVSEAHFAGSTGYGIGDRGREALDKVYAYAFGAEQALVRHSFVCGTHTLAVALFGVLRPGDTMLCVTGTPYDTIRAVIGTEGNCSGSLKDFGIKYEQLDLKEDGTVDYEALENAVDNNLKMVYIQRSRGYSLRPTLTCSQIEKIACIVRKKSKNAVIMLDNCYGEFVETREPLACGVDIMAGSLIKNAGGGIAPTGGYIAGKSELVEQCAYRLTTPGIGGEQGATLGLSRELFLGAFNAPHAVGEALKTAVFASALFELLGYDVTPHYYEERGDIIQVLKLGTPQRLIDFCRGVQSGAPVDSFVCPEPSPMPGYSNDVIMASGAFTLGSTIELSADAPLRPPYAAWLQGGLNFHSGKIGVMLAANRMKLRGGCQNII